MHPDPTEIRRQRTMTRAAATLDESTFRHWLAVEAAELRQQLKPAIPDRPWGFISHGDGTVEEVTEIFVEVPA